MGFPPFVVFVISTTFTIQTGCKIRNPASVKSFRDLLEDCIAFSTLVMIPPAISTIIMIVNHDIGTGLAVAGAFSLVRFRSLPGNARELGMLFLAMGAGLTAGMGQMLYALIFTVMLCTVFLFGNHANLRRPTQSIHRTLNVTIPKDLDYTGIFDDLIQAYTTAHELVRVKTTNMGSMFRLTYRVTLREARLEKSLIDSIRCRNGNLEITVSNQETAGSEL
ncbi:MAG: DUF4956 domain-containing protein [Oscillospiraceae bacterium]|nr:DUF4956 domain-containing protein [Oscillospiraceae bacterium]